MKAILYERYGPPEVLHLREVEKPTPTDNQVLIQVYAASINSRDWRLLRANPFFVRLMVGGLLRPKHEILGADMAGVVESVGNNVRQFQSGDEVFGYLSNHREGTFAEYTCAGENDIALKPANLSFEQAAAVPLAAMTALQGLRDKGNIQPGQNVLIQGASGGVGMYAVQIAKSFGATVTGVCSTRNVDMVRSIGADRVVDYTKQDFTRNGQRYDLILAVNGYHPISDYMRALTPEGTCVVAGGSMAQLFQAMLQRRGAKSGEQKTHVVSLVQNQKDLLFVKELLESGKVAPVIDGCYPLDKTVQAFQYFENVHPKGKIVITIRGNHIGAQDELAR